MLCCSEHGAMENDIVGKDKGNTDLCPYSQTKVKTRAWNSRDPTRKGSRESTSKKGIQPRRAEI